MKPETSAKNRKLKLGALTVLSLFFAFSAMIRVGVEAAPAIGREMQKSATNTPYSIPAPNQAAKLSSEKFSAALAVLQERERKVKEAEEKVSLKLRNLEVVEKKIDQKLINLVEAEKNLKDTLALADGAAQADIERLVSLYEQMKPKEAAALFAEMDPNFAAGFLARMNTEAAASVMAGLDPKSAYTISVYLAGRNSKVPTE